MIPPRQRGFNLVDPHRQVMIDRLFGEAMLPVEELVDVPNAIHSTSGRADVQYETWRGRKRDRKMLELLRAF